MDEPRAVPVGKVNGEFCAGRQQSTRPAMHSGRAYSAHLMRPRLARLLGGRSFSSDGSAAPAAHSALPQAVAEAAWPQRPAVLSRSDAMKYPNSRRQTAQITRHTLQSNFRPISLKTNDRCHHKVTHFSRVVDGPLATNHSPLATAFLIDTPAIRNALNSNHSNADTTSIRHRSGACDFMFWCAPHLARAGGRWYARVRCMGVER
jgi:hypothetical protein